jgi:carboxyl-terminal processing protease
MKFKSILFAIIGASALLVAAYCPKKNSPPEGKDAILETTLLEIMKAAHFSPQAIDDAFSKKVYKQYMSHLDAGRRFLTQEDVNQLKVYENLLDDEANAGNFDFFNLSYKLLNEAIIKSEGHLASALASPIDFNKIESVELDGDKKPWAKNDGELRDLWRKSIKYDVMVRIIGKMEEREKGNEKLKGKSDGQLQTDALTEVTKSWNDYFKRVKKLKRSDRLTTFLNSIMSTYDPHTEYFEPVAKQDFDISMSGRLIGIGARLQSDPDGEFTKVSEVIIGGPAWKQKELQEGDLIMKVAQGEKEPVEVSGMELADVVQMIRGKESTEVRLTVKKKADGSIKIVPIIREEVIFDEGFVKSLIIQDSSSTDKIGYIKLPKFYADFEKADGHQCAADVEIEIEKLKKENVKGIVIDLRNNGGGSLTEVVKMSGFFVEKGPIVQVKAKSTKPEVLTDEDESVQYSGPLVIMVNEFSASASEIMAAALQDYGRAIIVGSKTYGKGTVQRFIDLDRAYRGGEDVKPLGQVKLTIQKFFRINGSSTQLKGVVPDIALPDNYTEIKVGEADTDYPMPFTSIQPVTYNQGVVSLAKMPEIIKRSNDRVKANPTFGLIADNAKRIKNQREATTYPLNMKEFKAYETKQKAELKKYDDIRKPIAGFKAYNMAGTLEAMGKDSSKIGRNTEWVKDVSKDIHLYETLSIMRDLIMNSGVASKN